MKREEWLKTLKSDPVNIPYPEFDKKIRQHIREKGSIDKVEGALGDGKNFSAYVESNPEIAGSVYTKFYGITYLYKGVINSRVIDSVAQTKRMFMATAEFVLRNWFLIPLLFLLKKSVLQWIVRIYRSDLSTKLPPLNQFSPFSKEIIRVAHEATGITVNRPEGRYTQAMSDLSDLIICLVSFFEFDTAYRFRFQDAMGETLTRNNLRKKSLVLFKIFSDMDNPIIWVRNAFDLAISREKHIKEKLIALKKLSLLILWLSPKARRFVKEFVAKLDINKIRLDRADFYFCLRRIGYNYRGISYDDRLKFAKQIDKEKGHIILGI